MQQQPQQSHLPFRAYQTEADDAIARELDTSNACLVKMFCGTGKSLLMRHMRVVLAARFVVYVLPSLALIDQFVTEYLSGSGSAAATSHILRVSSDGDSTTDIAEICTFMELCFPARLSAVSSASAATPTTFVCVTYQSYGTFLEALRRMPHVAVDVCVFDEAHHAVGKTYQEHIFGDSSSQINKKTFFTATPVNTNGIVMYDNDPDAPAAITETRSCGPLAYEYTYLRGVEDGFLNPFEIRVDLYLENTNTSVYESIARAILVTGNTRVLTFHADVNTDRDTSVRNFVDKVAFRAAFAAVLRAEFPELRGKYRKIHMIGLYADVSVRERARVLRVFDATADDEIMIISSCETIGEGIDTKRANMCVFADPKSSFVKITQNIGRIVRRPVGTAIKCGTILLPCWVNREKYVGCGGDPEQCDAVIREDLNAGGNFNVILNVMSALRQHDEELYNVCLHYPDVYSRAEIAVNLDSQGFRLGAASDSLLGALASSGVLASGDEDLDYDSYEDCFDDAEIAERFAEENGCTVEIHTDNPETPVETYGCSVVESDTLSDDSSSVCSEKEKSEKVIRVFRSSSGSGSSSSSNDSESDTESSGEHVAYHTILDTSSEDVDKNRKLQPINNAKRALKTIIHCNPDVKVLWNISGMDLSRKFSSCVLDCEVVRYDPMVAVRELVERAKERERNGGRLFPRKFSNPKNAEEMLECKDNIRILNCKAAIKIKSTKNKRHINVEKYFDINLPGWNEDLDEIALQNAKDIVNSANKRILNGLSPFPKPKLNAKTDDDKQEFKDYNKLRSWKNAYLKRGKGRCSDLVKQYLDIHIPGWMEDRCCDKMALERAIGLISRAKERELKGLNLIPKKLKLASKQEISDLGTLIKWRQGLKENAKTKCPKIVSDYLDIHLLGWRGNKREEIDYAIDIVERANERKSKDMYLIPNGYKNPITEEEKQEKIDSLRLYKWKNAIHKKTTHPKVWHEELKNYLTLNLPGWDIFEDTDEYSMQQAEEIVDRALIRKEKGLNLLPGSSVKCSEQERKDSSRLLIWKMVSNGKAKGKKCPEEVKKYLDKNLPGWDEYKRDQLSRAKDLVNRARERRDLGQNYIPKHKLNDNLQTNDFRLLTRYKTKTRNCPNEVITYLDEQLPGWRPIDTQTPEQKPNEPERPTKLSDQIPEPTPKTRKPRTTKTVKASIKPATLQRQCQHTPQEPMEEAETVEAKAARTLSEISAHHKKYKTMNSATLAAHFSANPEEFAAYHRACDENMSTYQPGTQPHEQIIRELDKIKTKKPKLVLDLGCGQAKIARHYGAFCAGTPATKDPRFMFINYDHQAIVPEVTPCDITCLPHEDNEADICVLSFALWGSNCLDALREAYRVLASHGVLFVLDSTKRWSDKNPDGYIEPGMEGARLARDLESIGFRIMNKQIDKFCLFVCMRE